jgi:3-oxoacyl-[acyl-carrier-protein] synthase III
MNREAVCESSVEALARVAKQRAFVNPRLRHGLKLQSCGVAGVGAYLPAQVLTNADVGRLLGDDGCWIFPRTGISERRIAAEDEFTSDLAAHASLRALRNAGVAPGQVELILVATNTPDMMFPATACLVQAKIGAGQCPGVDLKAGGAGFLHALVIGQQFVASRTFETVLVVGAEKLSSVLDWRDRETCVLFGDGAGAVVLRPAEAGTGVLGSSLGADGTADGLLTLDAGGSRTPASVHSVTHGLHFLRMQGPQTFKAAVTALCVAAEDALKRSSLTVAELDCIIPHQSNRRIIEAFAKRLGAEPSRLFLNLEHCGNTSAASIPIALAAAIEAGCVKPGARVLLVGFGGGLTWGASVIQW